MSKLKPEHFKSMDAMLSQGARSRFVKANLAIDDAEEAFPENEFGGTAEDLRKTIQALNVATTNVCELIAYRKMMGVD